jgi:hypothetical protein
LGRRNLLHSCVQAFADGPEHWEAIVLLAACDCCGETKHYKSLPIRRSWVRHSLRCSQRVGHFSLRLAAARTVNPAPLPFALQFSPFHAYYLTYSYWHAILSRVCQAPAPIRAPNRTLSPRPLVHSRHSTPLLSYAYALFCATALPQPLSFQSFPHSFYRHGGVHPLSQVSILSLPQSAKSTHELCTFTQ